VAQQPGNIPRIGFLTQAPPAGPNIEAFWQGLRGYGYVEGKSIVIEYRDAGGKPDHLPGLASDLVRLKVNAIVVVGTEATLAAKNATGGKHYGVRRFWPRIKWKTVRTA